MRKPRKKSFADLVNENRQALLKDTDALLRIEEELMSATKLNVT
ncbi:FbpB family small basic protein [Bacillus coahuilensis]|nr:FbpB family small basic protein [Bacillus coahuilensis]